MTPTVAFAKQCGARRIGALTVGIALAVLAGCGGGGSGGSATDSAAATMRPTRTPLFGGFTVTAGRTGSTTATPTSGLPGTATTTPEGYTPVLSGTATVTPTTSVTPIVSPTPVPTRTPAPPGRGVLHIGRVQGRAGEYVSFDVTLDVDEGVEIAGTQNDIGFDPNNVLRVENTDGDPFCVVNPDIGKEHASFGFPPETCGSDGICVALRVLVLSFENVDPIPSGARLYTCTVALSHDAPVGAVYPLVCSNAAASTPDGIAVEIDCEDGAIVVGAGPTPIPTPIPDPLAAGVCYESSTCDQFPVQRTRGDCCAFWRDSGLPCTWCPADMVDPSSGACTQCLNPCDGL